MVIRKYISLSEAESLKKHALVGKFMGKVTKGDSLRHSLEVG